MTPVVSSSSSYNLELLLEHLRIEPAALVQVNAVEGSVPREAGAWMAVFSNAVIGTVGGGHLEFEAIAQARLLLASGGAQSTRFALGPALGQCCGGVVHLRFECVGAGDIAALRLRLQPALQPVALFGGGHVGHALVDVLARLPFAVTWIDSRDDVFPGGLTGFSAAAPQETIRALGGHSVAQSERAWGPNVICEHSEPVQSAVRGLAAQSRVLIMSFSHAEDLEVLAACLQRQREHADLPYIGLIGSKTKWATFRSRLRARGYAEAELAHVTSPIGVPDIAGKEPEVIAVAVAAQLLQGINRV